MRLRNYFPVLMPRCAGPRRQVRGTAVIEVTLIAPWFLFLFVGVVDMGFYSHQLIAVENAARVAAEYTSTGTSVADDSAGACTIVRTELAALANVSGLANCDNLPLKVTATKGAGLAGLGTATTVTVTYQSSKMVPIPGLLMNRLTFSRTVVVRVKP
jgi:Flp pilus assembly protein TadG